MSNPFDELDLVLTPEEQRGLENQPMPTLAERFWGNADQAYYTGTLAGGTKGQTVDQVGRDVAVGAYDAMPQWETPLEGVAAFAGQIYGSMSSPENFIPIGPGVKLVEMTGIKGAPWMARFFAGAIDAGLANAGVDALVQGAEIGGGDRQSYDPTQTAVATGLGALIGGAAGTLAKGAVPGEGNHPVPPMPEPPKAGGEIAAAIASETSKAGPASPEARQGALPAASGEKSKTVLPVEAGHQPPPPPALGDTLDATARAVRGLPEPPKAGGEIAAAIASETSKAGPASPEARQGALPAASGEKSKTVLPVEAGHQPPPPPALGDTLDATARAVRGLPERPREAQMVDGTVKRQAGGVHARPLNVFEFMAQAGGLRDDGGELTARGLTYRNTMTKFGPVFRKAGEAQGPDMFGGGSRLSGKGLSPDQMRERLVEAGYMPTDREGRPSQSAATDIYDLLERQISGEAVVSQRDMAWQAEVDAQKKADAAHDEFTSRWTPDEQKIILDHGTAGQSLVSFFQEHGFDAATVDPEDVKLAAAFMRDGMDADMAFERATLMNVEADFQSLPDAVRGLVQDGNQEDIPFGSAPHEAGSQTAGHAPDARGVAPDARGAGSEGVSGAQPGEAGTAASHAVEAGPDGKPQTIIPGTERITGADLAKRQAAEPLKAKAAQNFVMDEGLFGDGHKQKDLFSLATGPRAGQLSRDAAGIAASPGHVADPPAVTRLKDTAEQLMTRLDAVAVRMGRIEKAKAAGVYKTRSGVIRLKTPDDFDTLAHELGHHVEASIGKPVKDLMVAHRAELEPMAYEGADPKAQLEEGFAEFMRQMATNPAAARQQAPAFDAAFRAMLGKDHPEVMAAIDDAARAWRGWLEQPSAQAVLSTIVSSEVPKVAPKLRQELARFGLGNTIAERMSRFYGAALDDLHPINRAVRGLAKLYTANTGKVLDLKVADDAYKLARLSRGAYAAGQQDLMHGVADYATGQVVSSSLRDAIVMATGKANVLAHFDDVKVKQFGSYLWSRRALGEWERFDAGLIPNPPDKLTRGDHAQNVKDLEAAFPQFAEAAPLVHDFAQALWTKKRDAGLITHEQWADGLKIKDYVPGLRAFDQLGDPVGKAPAKGGGSAKGGLVKRFRGSTRDVINPLESLMVDAHETANAIARNDVIRALDRLAAWAGPGGGAIAERIPAHQMKGTLVDVMEALRKAAKDNGVADADYITMRDMVEGALGDDAQATLFRPAIINEKGEAIAFFREGGELKALRLADGQFGRDMQRALSGMTRTERQVFDIIALPLAKAASISRLGVVADIPFLVKNFIRDQLQAFLFYGGGVKNFTGTLEGMKAEIMSRDIARAYNAHGGIMGGANTATVRDARVNRSLNALARKGWAANRFTSFKGLLEATELSETGMRLNLFKRFTEEAKGRGLREHEAMLEGAWQARDYIDFDRRGSLVTPVARLIPFLNANLQGPDKFTRQMLAPLFREGVTVAEQAERGAALKAWARLSAVAVGTLALHALMAEDDVYKDADPDLKARNWLFKWDGAFVAIPKPFETMAFINMGPAIFDGLAKHDPRWAETVKASLRAAFLPPDIVLGNPIVKTTAEAYTGNDLRTGNQIIPAGKEALEPMLQYSARSSDVARAMGQALNVPPVWVDQIILNFSTSLGRTALSLSDYAMSDKPIGGWDDFVITSSFIKDVSRNASSSRAFWDLVGQRNGALEGARRSYETLVESGDLAAASDFLNKQDETTKAWVMMGSTKAEVRRLHPFTRARNAVTAIRGLREDILQGQVETADGLVMVSRRDRGAVDDILSKLAMTEARNALVMMGVPGWKGRDMMETAGYYRELQAVSPPLAKALADRFATAKVLPLDTVEKLWPELQHRLLRDGGAMIEADLAAQAKAAGYEGDGTAIKRKPRLKVVPGG